MKIPCHILNIKIVSFLQLHISNTTLLERSNILQQSQKDVQYYKSAQDSYDQNYKVEKVSAKTFSRMYFLLCC